MLNDADHLRNILHGCIKVGLNSTKLKATEKPTREFFKSSNNY